MLSQLILYKPEINPDVYFVNLVNGISYWNFGTGWTYGTNNNNGLGAEKMGVATSSLKLYRNDGVYTDQVLLPNKTYKWTTRLEFCLNGAGGYCQLEIGGVVVETFPTSGGAAIYTGTITTGSTGNVQYNASSTNDVLISWLNIVEIPSDYAIDLTDDIVVPLTYSIADIQDPSKRNASFSKTVTIPGTKNNNKFFNHIFEISIDGTYNPNKKVKMEVVTDGIVQLQGYAKLSAINRIQNGLNNYDLVSYELVLYGNLGDLFYSLGDLMLTDLDFSEYNHAYTRQNQDDSWYTQIKKNGTNYTGSFTNGTNLTISSLQNNNGRAQFNFASTHGLSVGDWLLIPKDACKQNGLQVIGNSQNAANSYLGEHMVYSVISSTSLVIQMPWIFVPGGFSTMSTGPARVHKHNPNGEGYVYPMIDYDQQSNYVWNVTQFYPALFIKNIIDKIFSKVNFKYNSTFFDQLIFKKMIMIPNSGVLQIPNSEVQKRLFRAESVAATTNWPSPGPGDVFNTFTMSPKFTLGAYQCHQVQPGDVQPTSITVPFTNDSTNGNYDPGNNYSTMGPNYSFTCPANGLYTLNIKGTIFCNWQHVNSVYQVNSGNRPNVTGDLRVQIQNTSGFIDYDVSAHTLGIQNYSSIMPDSNQVLTNFTQDIDSQFPNISLVAGQQYYVRLVWVYTPRKGFYSSPVGNPAFYYPNPITVNYGVFGNFSFWDQIDNVNVQEGDTVFCNALLPKIKCVDFMSSIIKMFNLYLQPDNQNSKLLNIETRNDFYNAGQTLDWTEKLDISQDIQITPMGELNNKIYSYSYKDDKDFYNTDHLTNWGSTYGNRKFIIDNDFVKDTYDTSILFSPTIIAKSDWGGDYAPISNIQKATTTNIQTPGTGNPRILVFNCAATSNSGAGLFQHYSNLSNQNPFTMFYPYAGHLDKPDAPYYDLNFDFPKATYFTTVSWTDRNLFNLYYKNMIEEITDKNSKIITCYMHLTAKDIFELDFRNIYVVDGHFLRLNKIIDFNVGQNITTKCEFLKIHSKAPFISTMSGVGTMVGESVGVNLNLTGFNQSRFPSNGTQSNSSNQGLISGRISAQGDGNTIGLNNYKVTINGDNNIIGNNSSNIMIDGNNNTINNGLSNIAIIGTSGLTITESNVSYINGVKISQSGAILNTKTNTIDAGLDIVLTPFNDSKLINLVDGSVNLVQGFGSMDLSNTIDGGIDSILNP